MRLPKFTINESVNNKFKNSNFNFFRPLNLTIGGVSRNAQKTNLRINIALTRDQKVKCMLSQSIGYVFRSYSLVGISLLLLLSLFRQ